jgi:hypothetical protein
MDALAKKILEVRMRHALKSASNLKAISGYQMQKLLLIECDFNDRHSVGVLAKQRRLSPRQNWNRMENTPPARNPSALLDCFAISQHVHENGPKNQDVAGV